MLIHSLCQCLFLVPFAHTQSVLAQEAGSTTSTVAVDLQAEKSNSELQENLQHEEQAVKNGGLNSKCDQKSNDTMQNYLDRQDYLDTTSQQNLDLITNRRNELNALTDSLAVKEGIQSESDPVATKEVAELTAKADAAKKEMDRLKALYSKFPPRERGEHNPEREQAFEKYMAARNEYRSLRRTAANKEARVNNTIAHVTTVQDTQAVSDAISGCRGSGATKTCELSGSLYEKDEELTRLANENVEIAVSLAKEKSDALLSLELESQYNGDYKLFESAILMENKNLNLDDYDQMTDADPSKTRDIAMMISNIKTLAMSSAAVKELECTQDPKSEADSKSYHLFRAAAATYLMAQVNDTGLYTNSSSCRATEEYTSDTKNLQIRTVERAANISQEQLENICLRVNPTPPESPYDWKIYGDSPEDAQKKINGLASLKQECDAYLEKLRGPEYVDKPRTREAALEMMTTAMNLAIEELAAKREKVATAYANIQKGKAWVKRVKTYIATMLAMAAALKLASSYFYSLSLCAGCAKGSSLMKKAMYIIGIVVGIYLLSELARAKAFLRKWQKRMDYAKSFTHLKCNYAVAASEESSIINMADKAKASMLEEVKETKNNTIEDINTIINTQSTDTTNSNKDAPTTTFVDFLMELIPSAHATDAVIQKSDDKRLSKSLGVAYGSESFRFFLAQKVEHWKVQSNHILEVGNTSNRILKTRDQLVAPFLDGTAEDPLEGLTDYEKNGFPVPETRLVTITNAVALMTENIGRINGVIGDISTQRDNYRELLNEFRNKLNITGKGLSDNDQPVQQSATTQGYCLNASGDLDQTCQCRMNNTCSQFRFKLPEKFLPGALKEEASASLNHANGLLTGNLAKANIAAGFLGNRSNAISERMRKALEALNKQRKDAGLNSRDIEKEASGSNRVIDSKSNIVTSNSAPSGRSQNSAFSRARNSLLGNPSTKSAILSNDKEEGFSSFKGFNDGVVLGDSSDIDTKKSIKNETFTFDSGIGGGGSGGLGSRSKNGLSASLSGNANSKNLYGHERNLEDGQGESDINAARNQNIFTIISKRYKKTAYPVLLLP